MLKLDKSLRNNRFFQQEPLSIELIKNALKEFFIKINEIEQKRFRAKIPNYEEFFIKIGKHSGAWSKSLNGLRKVKIRQLNRNFDYQLSVWIDENENPLGWGKLEFEG